MDNNNIGRPTMLNSLNMSKTGLTLATNLEATELASPSGKLSSSLVLDTKDFVIGQRVYVGGTRPGQIAYIGETHFAPGEWVGVVLDDASGKNDGCVAGKRYFQCEPKRGVFSRINRLTLHPVAVRDNSSEKEFDVKSSRAASPSSVRSGIPTKIGSTISRKDFKVGDRVIVSSGLGSRPGELKYIGETKFAPGTWCGIQLDEPSGKNDGTVDGEKYFECPDKYGIFVPVAKVSLSPLARKSNLSRMGSQESLTSVGTMNSFATTNTSRLRMSLLKGKRPSTSGSNAFGSTSTPLTKSNKNAFSLQDVLREKQNYIEQLITERELDREDTQSQNILFQKQICDLKETITHLDSKLIDKTNKFEELQNTLDESQFCSAEKITQLEEKLSNLVVSGGSNKSESNEINCKFCPKMADERDQLKLQVQKLLNELETIKLTNLNSDKSIESQLREFEIKSAEYEKNILHLKNEKDILANELLNKKEQYQEDISVTNEKYSIAQQEINELNKDKENIKKEKTLLLEKLEAKETEMLNKIAEIKSGDQNNESRLNEKDLQMKELQDRIGKITENNKQQLLEKSEHIQKLLTELETMKSNLTVNRQEKSENLKNLQEIKENLNSVQLEAKNCQLENNKLNEINRKLDIALNDSNKQVETLKIDLNTIKTENEQFANELKIANNTLSKETALRNENKDKFLVDLEKSKEEFKNLSQKFDETNAEISKLSELNKNLTTELNDKLIILNEKSNLLNEFESKLHQTNLEKIQIETKLNEMMENSKKSSTKLEVVLNEKISEIENLKRSIGDSEARNNELNQKLNEKNLELDNSLSKIKELVKSIEEKEKSLNLKNEKLQEIEKQSKNASNKIAEIENILLEKNKDMENLNKIIENNAEKLQLFESKEKDMENIIQNKKDELSSIFQTISKLEIEISQLKDEKSLLQQKIDNQDGKLKELKEENQNLNTKLIHDNENLTISAKNEIQKLTDLLSERQQNSEKLEIKLNELNIEFSRLDNSLKLEKLENEVKTKNLLSLKNELETAQRLSVDIQSKLESNINELKNEKLSIIADLEKLQKEFNNKEIEINETGAVIQSKNLEIIDLNKIITELSSDILSVKNDNKKLKEESSNKSSEHEVMINNLKTALEKLDKEKAELMDSEKNVKDSLNLEQKQFYEELEKKNSELNQFELILSEKLKTIEEISNKNNELLAQVESNSTEIKMLSEQNGKKSDEFEKLTIANEKMLQLNEKLKAEWDLLSSETDAIKINLDSEKAKFSLAEKEIEVLKTDMESLKKTNNLLLEEKEYLSNICEKLKNETNESELKYTAEIKSLTEQINIKTKELNEISENFNQIKIDKLKLETVFSERNAESTEKTAAFEEIRNKFSAAILEKTKEIEELKSNLTVVIEQNKETCTKLSDEKDTLTLELDKRANELKIKNDEMMTQHQSHEEKLKVLNLKIQELTVSLTDQMKKSDEALKEKSKSVEETSENVKKMQEEIIKLELANNILIKSEADLKDELLAVQHEKQDALNNIELFGVEYDNEIENVKENNIKLQIDLDFLQAICNQKEKDIAESKNMYEQINLLLKEKNSAIAKLQIELNDLKRYNDNQIKQNAAPVPILPINIGGSGDDGSCEDQVNFLNSIIADMFKKNEDLKTRIDLLETNPIDFANSSTLTEYTAALSTIKRKPAPRVFCDICDEFDKHNTEDCPLQESDEIQEFPVRNGDKDKTKPEPRKYCESCEMFGHETGACADDESF